MSSKQGGGNTLFDNLTGPRSEGRERRRGTGILDQRQNRLSEMAAGAVESKTHRWVDPARCRMWKHHDRFYDLLDQERCQDLIDQFLTQGKQEMPAIVRKLDDDADFDYEVICGARRHWTVTWLRKHNYPEFQFLIEVRDLTDEQAFRISDIENRGHEDLSDYERALKYQRAIGTIYKTQGEMAERNRRSTTWMSRYLDLADLPQEVVDAYGDVLQIRVAHARELKPLLKVANSRKAVVAKAGELKAEQAARRQEGRPLIDGVTVLRQLKAASTAKRRRKASPKKLTPVEKDGQVVLSGTYDARSGWTLKIPASAGGDRKAVLEAVGQALDEAG